MMRMAGPDAGHLLCTRSCSRARILAPGHGVIDADLSQNGGGRSLDPSEGFGQRGCVAAIEVDVVADMARIFESFVHEDETVASAVQNLLQTELELEDGVFLSSDKSRIYGGDLWLQKIKEGLSAAELVILMLSKRSVVRPWINFEAGAAWLTDKRSFRSATAICRKARSLIHCQHLMPCSCQQTPTIYWKASPLSCNCRRFRLPQFTGARCSRAFRTEHSSHTTG